MGGSPEGGAGTVLPRQRAFLVQLAPSADPASGGIAGRAVHIDSGSAASFASLAELLRLFATLHAVGSADATSGENEE